jgi:hypothetical protein
VNKEFVEARVVEGRYWFGSPSRVFVEGFAIGSLVACRELDVEMYPSYLLSVLAALKGSLGSFGRLGC